MNSLNGGYAMIKYNSTQEELQIAYRSKKPVLCYDENRRAHWAVIEETATESVDEETQEPITIYEYSYRLIDEASGGGKLYQHVCHITDEAGIEVYCLELITRDNTPLTLSNLVTILTNRYTASQNEDFHVLTTNDKIYVSRAYVFDKSIRIRKSSMSNISSFVNFDATVLENDIISEI